MDDLVAPADREPDVDVTLTARAETFDGRRRGGRRLHAQRLLAGARRSAPSRASSSQVRLVNESVEGGATLHWHGVDVPNAVDGVAGVTQDAVPVGGEHVYRFVAEQVGTFWYHSHQLSHEQVRRGLLGALVVEPDDGTAAARRPGGRRRRPGPRLRRGPHGRTARPGTSPTSSSRAPRSGCGSIGTDNGALSVWVSGAPFRLRAVDGTEVVGPETVEGVAVQVTAGARADLEIETPADGSGARVDVGGGAALVLGPGGRRPAGRCRGRRSTSTRWSTASRPRSGSTPTPPTASSTYRIGRAPGFLDGRPGLWWTVNGGMLPDVPMFVVSEGDVVRMTVSNSSGDGHPMHLHGHHAVVLSRDGVPATGSPWWVDSLHVADGETYELAFVADNPGIWMDHCHNLPHAAQGLVAHLMYEGVSTPYRMGGVNEPE